MQHELYFPSAQGMRNGPYTHALYADFGSESIQTHRYLWLIYLTD